MSDLGRMQEAAQRVHAAKRLLNDAIRLAAEDGVWCEVSIDPPFSYTHERGYPVVMVSTQAYLRETP